MTTTPNDRRQALADGLRALADFLQEHPDLPASTGQEIHHCVGGRDDAEGITNLTTIAELLGGSVTATGGGPLTEATTHFQVSRSFGPVHYRATYIRRAEMDAWNALMSYSGRVTAAPATEVTPC
ncbi:hypothetical protein [Paractinoplanes brasiliensis]|uniref:Uncharacterized protein n=1 Tax=Paractinoplanes brasiliensis TaxID=52695 RepID=A0A4R6JPG0_9ACTN|nr:hypothetical protein [Actinoplanes brasiliensis]TDO38403.1 hypothetical protein C8E87_2056 [Actinoplanes brasiliensis]GID26820.1 hypothetical protein Abr02nite_18030 [Actinoplanes brasiliensis]